MTVRQVLTRSRAAAWFRQLSPVLQALVVIVVTATLTAALAMGGLLTFFAWNDHQFKNGPYVTPNQTTRFAGDPG